MEKEQKKVARAEKAEHRLKQKAVQQHEHFKEGFLFTPLFSPGASRTTMMPEPTLTVRRQRTEAWRKRRNADEK